MLKTALMPASELSEVCAMQLIRRWLAYRRLLDELAEARTAEPGEARVCRCAVRDFAWHCAGIEAERAGRAHRSAIDAA
jgi:hypothetical protein